MENIELFVQALVILYGVTIEYKATDMKYAFRVMVKLPWPLANREGILLTNVFADYTNKAVINKT